AALAPFTCRFHKTEDDETGKWEIWLPGGCASVGEPCEPLNLRANEVEGHEDDAAGWRLLCFVDEPTYWNQYANAETYQETYTDGEGVERTRNVTRRTWEVHVHAKTSAKVYGADTLESRARRLLYASARPMDSRGIEEQETLDARFWNKNKAGDEFSACVGRIVVELRVIDGKAVTSHTYEHFRKTPLDVAARARTGFELVWYFSVHEKGYLTFEKLYCVMQELAAAGITLRGPEMTDVTAAQETIYAKIKTNPLDKTGTGVVEVVTDPTGMRTDDDLTWLQLYRVDKDHAVTADWRAVSLANVQVYR
ncbi:MAG: hypothetical protein IJ658_10370, partial [Kiritimatiellae bacterium]|nr:hypothetical protein [Kiritimatiellia bacterium]